jgi:hypothetical protein
VNIAFLLKLLATYSTVLPQALPILLHIAQDLRQLVALLPVKAAARGATAEAQQAVNQMVAAGMDSQDAADVVDAFAAADANES